MRIAIIGSGVIGLTTAIKLLQQGREVVIYSKDTDQKKPDDTVSLVACALWQPYKLFKNLDEYEVDKFELVKQVSLNSLQEFDKILSVSKSEESGVYTKTHYEYSAESIYTKATHKLKKDFYYIGILNEFWKEKGENNAIFKERKLKSKPPFKAVDKNNKEVDFEYLHGYKTYVIDPSIFLKYLTNMYKDLGGEIVKKNINLNELKKLKEKIVFNCAGLNGFSIINNKNFNAESSRRIIPKKGVLILYKLKEDRQFENTIVLDELTILCRHRELTIGTGEIKEGEKPEILIERLKCHAKEFSKAKKIDKFGFDTFIKRQQINIDKPSNILIGARPYFPDGQGYVLDRVTHKSNLKNNFTMYNNFGHGGSGVTLSWGCANEITKLYLNTVSEKLNSINKNRTANASNINIEIAHFEVKLLHDLSNYEIDELVKREHERLIQVYQKLDLYSHQVGVSVLIDDKETPNDRETINRLITALKKVNVDFVAYESRLINYIDKLKPLLPSSITKEFNSYLHNHYKLGCAQDIFVWYCLRFGLIDFNFDDEVIIPISESAGKGEATFAANSIITLLDKGVKYYEDKADEYLNKSFGFEIASSVRRFYYQN